MAVWDTSDLVTRVKRKAQWTSSAKLTDTELLAIGDEELQTFIAPMVRSVSDGYWVKRYTTAITAAQPLYRIPPRATAGTIYDVSIVDSAGNTRRLLKRSASDLYMTRFGWDNNTTSLPIAYVVEADTIRLLPSPSSGLTLLVRYERRPSQLVATTACQPIATVSTSSLTTTSALSGYSSTYGLDIVQALPNFDATYDDLVATQSGSGPYTYTFSQTIANVSVGDYICNPRQTCIVSIPDVLYPILIDRIAAEALDEVGDSNLAAMIRTQTERKLPGVLESIEPRAETSAPAAFNRWSPMRS